ncbi:MAG: 4-hydroxy-3-methylbut-2-enyl diphosphate reductase [Mycobacteriaceae bacterium]
MRAPVVCTPLRVEHAVLARPLRGVDVVRTGMGAVAAGPRPTLVAGVGGGLDPRCRPGDLVVASEVRGPDATVSSPSAPLLAAALRRLGLTVHLGPIVTSEDVVHGARRRELAGTGALAVDMESAGLAAAADGYPFAVVRAVVDTAADPLLRPATAARGVRALRALRAGAPALADWAGALGHREVLLAGPRSFCAGVERAIDTVERALDQHGAPLYVRRQIVHNTHVVTELQRRGAVFVTELDEVPRGARVVLAAHGVSPEVWQQARERGLTVVDATCPLVAKVHQEVRRYAEAGNTVFLIGHRDHEEVVGTAGEAPSVVQVVEDAAQAARVQALDPDHVAYVMQTTLALDEAEETTRVLRERFPSMSRPRSADICYASTNRQQAVREVAVQSELVLVLGSASSSNSQRLVEVARRAGTRAQLVEDAGAVDLRWLAGVRRIGLTAGASAPPHLVDDLVHALSGLGPVTVREHTVTEEDAHFALPKEVS